MARVFISYRRHEPDQSVARAIRDRLIELEHQVFFDTTDLHTGEDWRKRLRGEIELAELFIPILSSSYVESAVILDEELVPAVRKYEQGTLRSILPVNLAYDGLPPENVRVTLASLQYAKWQQRADTTRVVEDVAARLPPSLSLIRGARAFDELDAEVFADLGRRGAVDRLVEIIEARERPHVLLHGASGAGKTSLLKAGLRPVLDALTVVELAADELHRVATAGEILALDQFEQVLIAFADDEERAKAFAKEVEVLTSGGTRFLFCIREEFRTPFEKLLPSVAASSTPFALLPFTPDEAENVLRKLLENGRVEYDADALPRFCEAMSEGVPRTVLPAILQIVVQHCRDTHTRLSAATRDDLVKKDRLFEDHIRDSVLGRVPRTVSEVDAAATLRALTDADVKSRWKTADEIASEEGVTLPRTERALRVASGRARVVTVDLPPGEPPRYRLAHDLFVAPVQRLYAAAKQRRVRRNRILFVVAVIVVIAAASLVFRGLSGREAALTARRAFDLAADDTQKGRSDAAALHAAEAFASARASDPLRPTYAIASLHASLALAPPVVQPHANFEDWPEIVEDEHVVVHMGEKTVAYPADGTPASVVLRLASKAIPRSAPDVAAIDFNSDRTLIVGSNDSDTWVWDATGKLLRHLSRGVDDVHLRANEERILSNGTVTNLRSGVSFEFPGKFSSGRFSGDGRRVATAETTLAGGTDLRVWDVATQQRIGTVHVPVREFRIDDVSENGLKVLGVGDDELVGLWDVQRGRLDQRRIAGFDFHLEGGLGMTRRRLRFTNGDQSFVSIGGGPDLRAMAPDMPDHSSSLGPYTIIGPYTLKSWTTDGTFRQWGETHSLPIDTRSMAISPDDAFLRAVLRDRRVVRVDLRPRMRELGAMPPGFPASRARMTPDLRYAVVTFAARPMRVLDLRARAYVDNAFSSETAGSRLTLLHDRFVVHDRYVREQRTTYLQVLDLQTGRWQPRKPLTIKLVLRDVAISPTGDELRLLGNGFASDARTRVVRMKVADGSMSEPQWVDSEMRMFSDDSGDTVVEFDGGEPYRFNLQNVTSGKRTARFTVNDPVLDVFPALLLCSRVQILSPNEIIVTVRSGAAFRITRRENDIVLTDPNSGAPLILPHPDDHTFGDAVFSTDGRRVALLEQKGLNDALQVWDLHTGNPMSQRVEITNGIAGAIFIENDTALAVMGGDGVVRRVYVGDSTPYANGWAFSSAGDWLRDLAAYATGLQLDGGGTIALTQDEHDAIRKRLQKRLREAAPTDPNARYALEQLGLK